MSRTLTGAASHTTRRLTRRQAEVLDLLRQGLCHREVADILFVSVSCVEWHRDEIIHKARARNLLHALSILYAADLRAEFAPKEITT